MSARLPDGPVFITNMGALITSTLEILHELDRASFLHTELAAMDRAISLLTIGQDACDWFVKDVESGPDFKPVRKTGEARS